jgi:hypothetical protein
MAQPMYKEQLVALIVPVYALSENQASLAIPYQPVQITVSIYTFNDV